jgi:hypothetical protein
MLDFDQENINKIQKVVKYILMGLIIISAIKYVPQSCLQDKEIYMIGALSSISFDILDMISPTIVVSNNEVTKDLLVE